MARVRHQERTRAAESSNVKILNPDQFTDLVSEAVNEPFSGWDFSYIRSRWRHEAPPWDYAVRVREAIASASTLLDMGTGGGERLASLAPLPAETYATEAYQPNVPIARARLGPLGVRVVPIEADESLLFDDGFFDLIINHHERFISKEVARILRPGGRFITQQVGERNNVELNRWLEGLSVPEPPSSLGRAFDYLAQAGLEVDEHREVFPKATFYDIGAVVYYLRAVPWQVEGFTVEGYYEQLIAMHNHIQAHGELETKDHRYYVEAHKPRK